MKQGYRKDVTRLARAALLCAGVQGFALGQAVYGEGLVINIDKEAVASGLVTIQVGSQTPAPAATKGVVIVVDDRALATESTTINVGTTGTPRAAVGAPIGNPKTSATPTVSAPRSVGASLGKPKPPQIPTTQVVGAPLGNPTMPTTPTVSAPRSVGASLGKPKTPQIPTTQVIGAPLGNPTTPTKHTVGAPLGEPKTPTTLVDNAVTIPKEAVHTDMFHRFQETVPDWTYGTFQTLDKEHLLWPEQGSAMPFANRREGAVWTARSYQRIRQAGDDAEQRSYSAEAQGATQELMREFLPELQAMGYGSIAEAKRTVPDKPGEWDWKYSGEIRYSLAQNRGTPRYTWSDRRWRLRLNTQKKIGENWDLYGMVESDKSHIFHNGPESIGKSSENDGHLELSRLYVTGQYEWWRMPFTIEMGKTYSYLGDGNILDSDFHGAKIKAMPQPDTTIEAGVGRVNTSEDMQYLEAWRQHRAYDYMGGLYHWHNYGLPTTIYAGGLHYYTGNYMFGATYLRANEADGSGAKDGYVLTARWGQNMSWVPHTFEFDLKYYNQAGTTYVNHTMNGLGGYMDGFSGWGAMAYYTLRENLMFSLQYYDVKNKTTDEDGRTVWSELTWGF